MNKKILIFDDHELIVQVLSMFLRQKGFKVTGTRSAREFSAILSKEKFDTIIADASITDMSVLRTQAPNSSIIFMSGHVSEKFLSEQQLPAWQFFKKPFSLQNILRSVQTSNGKDPTKILIVDDQDHLREMLVDYLKSKGFSIKEAKNGREAVQLAIEFPFDGILMDIRMPELDGIVALQEMLKVGIKTPVFLMSGYGDVKDADDAQALGAKDFLPKPFKLEAAYKLLENEG